MRRRALLLAVVTTAIVTSTSVTPVTVATATDPLPRNGRIVFAHFRDGAFSWDIHTMEADGSSMQSLSEDRARYEVGPQLSPDGRQIAYEFNHDVLVMNIDGSHRRLITDDGSASNEQTIRWSPDGTTVAFLSDRAPSREFLIFAAPIDGSSPPVLVSTGVSNVDYDGFDWLPDGSGIVFPGYADRWSLYRGAADGSGATEIPTGTSGADDPSVSPDGLHVVFVSGDIWEVPIAGGTATRLTSTGFSQYWPRWSPSGDRIAFAVGSTEFKKLYVMDAAGATTPLQIASAVYSYDWSPDGTRIVYRGGDEIRTIRPDGTGRNRLTYNAADDRDPDWGPACTIVGTSGRDVLTGTPGPDLICGRGGNDMIHGLAGDDVILGGPGDDLLYGDEGRDVIAGEIGLDRLYGGRSGDHVNGMDRLAGDTITGGAGNDRCRRDKGDPTGGCEHFELQI